MFLFNFNFRSTLYNIYYYLILKMDNILPPGIHNPSNFCYIISTIQCLKNLRSIRKFINISSKFDNIITTLLKSYDFKTVLNKEKFVEKIEVIEDKLKQSDEEILSITQEFKTKFNLTDIDFNTYFKKLKLNSNNIYVYIAFLNLLKQLLNNTNTVLNIKEFLIIFRIVTMDNGNQYISRGQNDASEFLVFLIDYLHESHSSSVQLKDDIPQEKMRDSVIEQMDLNQRIRIGFLKHFKSSIKNNYTSLINDLHHYTLNMIKCKSCQFANLSYSMENLLCLSLYQQNNQNQVISIYDTLNKHFEDEVIEGYACDKCKNNNGNVISKMLLTYPDTYIICLKRTGYNIETGMMEKLNITIEYPMILNLKNYYPSYMNMDSKDGLYKLSGVVNQVGDNNFGHYFSFVYDDNLEKWHLYNDENVTLIDESKVINNSNAYLLFYQKVIN